MGKWMWGWLLNVQMEVGERHGHLYLKQPVDKSLPPVSMLGFTCIWWAYEGLVFSWRKGQVKANDQNNVDDRLLHLSSLKWALRHRSEPNVTNYACQWQTNRGNCWFKGRGRKTLRKSHVKRNLPKDRSGNGKKGFVHCKKWGSRSYLPRKKLRDSQNFRDRALHPEKGFGKRPIPITFSE